MDKELLFVMSYTEWSAKQWRANQNTGFEWYFFTCERHARVWMAAAQHARPLLQSTHADDEARRLLSREDRPP